MNKKIPGKVWTHLIGNQPITIQLKFPSQRYYKNLGTSVNFSPMFPPSLFTCVAIMELYNCDSVCCMQLSNEITFLIGFLCNLQSNFPFLLVHTSFTWLEKSFFLIDWRNALKNSSQFLFREAEQSHRAEVAKSAHLEKLLERKYIELR